MSQTEVTSNSQVTLREITGETVRAICKLAVKPDQTQFVASNAISIAQAHFSDRAWFRAVYADETPVGFVMVEVNTKKQDYYLWRFMLDAHYQRFGFGAKALSLVIDYIKTLPGAAYFETSIVEGPGSPQGFYEKQGFVLTGEYEEEEALMRLQL